MNGGLGRKGISGMRLCLIFASYWYWRVFLGWRADMPCAVIRILHKMRWECHPTFVSILHLGVNNMFWIYHVNPVCYTRMYYACAQIDILFHMKALFAPYLTLWISGIICHHKSFLRWNLMIMGTELNHALRNVIAIKLFFQEKAWMWLGKLCSCCCCWTVLPDHALVLLNSVFEINSGLSIG